MNPLPSTPRRRRRFSRGRRVNVRAIRAELARVNRPLDLWSFPKCTIDGAGESETAHPSSRPPYLRALPGGDSPSDPLLHGAIRRKLALRLASLYGSAVDRGVRVSIFNRLDLRGGR